MTSGQRNHTATIVSTEFFNSLSEMATQIAEKCLRLVSLCVPT